MMYFMNLTTYIAINLIELQKEGFIIEEYIMEKRILSLTEKRE